MFSFDLIVMGMHIVSHGGRIKAASISYRHLYPSQYFQFTSNPIPENAALLYRYFTTLREHPSEAFFSAFFPLDPSLIKQRLRHFGLYRPILKTDQGPAGNFLGFQIGDDGGLTHTLTTCEGLAVPECYARNLLSEHTIQEISNAYRVRSLEDCFQKLQPLRSELSRTATVGRDPFFFCNPCSTTKPIVVSHDIVSHIQIQATSLLMNAQSKAYEVQSLYRNGLSLEEAVRLAKPSSLPDHALFDYCQVDSFIDSNGVPTISRVHLPDVLLFLTQIEAGNNSTFASIQQIVHSLASSLIDHVTSRYYRSQKIYLLTRDEVIIHHEDTLENLELKALESFLSEKGYVTQVITSQHIADLPMRSQILMLNINVYDPKYQTLLTQTAHGRILCSPNPFLKALDAELTELPSVELSDPKHKHYTRFLDLIKPGKHIDGSALFSRHRDICELYDRFHFSSDLMYCKIQGERSHFPLLKHSIHSFYSLYHSIFSGAERTGSLPQLKFYSVPFDPERSSLIGPDGPRLAEYRFLMLGA